MPFGLSNSPSVFQAFVNEIFWDMLHQRVIVYSDDILIYSDSLEEHVQDVRSVLKRLIDNQLYAKVSKCEFHRTRISLLGYIISANGVLMDDSKVSAVGNWPQPSSVKELQRFLSFANFYRRFIRNFSVTAAPLTSLLQGGGKYFKWTAECTAAFAQLKERFTSAPILRHPDPEKEFIIEVDASNTGVRVILSQRFGDPAKMFPCAFYSRKLNSAERNYDVGDCELLAMKSAFEEWRHWLEGARQSFTALTDHRNLEYIRPGSQNGKADALSRLFDGPSERSKPEPIVPTTLIVAPVQWDIISEITAALSNHPAPPECPADRLFVPPDLRHRVLQCVHCTPSAVIQ
ncbi:hypothetical protein F2P79_022123, partial [Pimephales promelas]